jgi:integrase
MGKQSNVSRGNNFKGKIIMKLTAANVARLVLPEGKADKIWLDDDLSGFGYRLRRTAKGVNKTWTVQFRFGKQQKRASFDVSKFTAEAARKLAKDYLAQVQLGSDPTAERDRLRKAASAITLTLGDAAARYLDAKRDVLRPSSFKSTARHFNTHWAPMCPRPLAEIKRAEIAARLQEIIKQYGRTAAARARSALNSLFAWSLREGLCELNPVIGTNDPGQGQARERVLSDRELAAVWNACRDDDFGRIVKLLILTGCRRDEIGSLKWSEIDGDVMTIAAARSKNRKAHSLTLPGTALDILQSAPHRDGRDFVFGQRGGGFARWGHHTTALRTRLGEMPAFVLHDLRRSFRTGLGKLGIPPHIAELAINHTRSGIEAVYDKHRYEREIASALAQWAAHVAAIIEGRDGNVVALRKSG